MPNLNYFRSQVEIFDMGRDAGQMSMNSKFAPDVFKYSLNYFVGDYQAVGFNQPFGNWHLDFPPDSSGGRLKPKMEMG